jgi:hypothetical protein
MTDAAVIAWKHANALIAEATPTPLASKIMGAGGRAVTESYRASGGLWVGGTVSLTAHELIFAPNAMNIAVHTGDVSRRHTLATVVQVADRFGWVTRIVDVLLEDGSVFTFRCFGARSFAEKVWIAAENCRPR